MKKFLLFLIFPFCVSQINAGNYQEMLKSGNKWNVLYNEIATCGGAFAYTTSLELTGDTVIESQNYKKMRGVILTANRDKTQFRDTIYAASLREDVQEQKVYIRYPEKREELLYNFNVKAGDTIKTISNEILFGLYHKTIRFVSRIDSFSFNGIKGRKINISDTLFYQRVDPQTKDTIIYRYAFPVDTLFEGVGMLTGPIELSTSSLSLRQSVRTRIKQCGQSNVNNRDFGYILQCFWSGTELLYHNPDPIFTECEYAYTVGIKEQFIEGISVYPNPTKGLVEIKSESGIELAELYDSIGNRIISTTHTTLDLSLLSSGVYFVKVIALSGKIKTVKVVKQ